MAAKCSVHLGSDAGVPRRQAGEGITSVHAATKFTSTPSTSTSTTFHYSKRSFTSSFASSPCPVFLNLLHEWCTPAAAESSGGEPSNGTTTVRSTFACECACVRVCMRACVRACVGACVHLCMHAIDRPVRETLCAHAVRVACRILRKACSAWMCELHACVRAFMRACACHRSSPRWTGPPSGGLVQLDRTIGTP